MKMVAHATSVQGADLQQEMQIRQATAVDQGQVARTAERAHAQTIVTAAAGSSSSSSTGRHLNARA